ncbi:MAG TPA: SAM-dependent methyltransferase [Streptosporangiaceae bacterium]|nr:SAM-dependent methyltransferase [Streptosporangiaceae bacterium]
MADRGSLTVVGSGIRAIGQVTLEAHAHIKQAEKLLVLVADPLTSQWLSDQNPTAESLERFYGEGKDRLQTYQDMVDHILSFVRDGLRVCAVFYGHPGVFAIPSHASVKIAQEEGYQAEMLAGVSADACLYADLGVDPGQGGCQSYEATDFLVRRRGFDPRSQLILWQIGSIGMLDRRLGFDAANGLKVLAERLRESYPGSHTVIVYEASPYAACHPKIVPVSLEELPSATVTGISTLYVPPRPSPESDEEVLELLGISAELRRRRREVELGNLRQLSTLATNPWLHGVPGQ